MSKTIAIDPGDSPWIAECDVGIGTWSLNLASGRQYLSTGLISLLELEPDPSPDGTVAWLRSLQPDDVVSATKLISRAVEQHGSFQATFEIVTSRSGALSVEVFGQVICDQSGRPARLSGYCIDVTSQRTAKGDNQHLEERLRFLLRLSDVLAPLSDPVQIQYEACRVLGEYLKANRVFYAEFDNDGLNRAGPQYLDGVQPTLEVWHTNHFDQTLLRRYRCGEFVTCEDVTRQPDLSDAQREAYAAEQISAWVAVPIVKPGIPLGRLVINQNRPRKWSSFEIELIKETAERVWPAVQRAKSQAALDVMEHIPVGTYNMILDPGSQTARFSFLSRRFLEMTGLNAEYVRRDPFNAFACVHPEDYDEWIKVNTDAFANLTPFLGETRIIVRGETRWVRAESNPRKLHDGTVIWEGVLMDITDQRIAEEALRKSEERYRLAIEITKEAWWEEDVTAQEYINSPRFCEMLGRGEELLRCSVEAYRDLIHPDDRAQARAAHDRGIQDNTAYSTVYRLRHADGHYIWVEDHARVIGRDGRGDAIRMLGTSADITARKQAELALQESEENFRRLFDDAPDAYVIMNQPDLTVLTCNQAVEHMFGGSREQIVGMTPDRLSPPVQPSGVTTRDFMLEKLKFLLEMGYARFEMVHRRFDGSDFWVEVTARTGTFRHSPAFYVTWREIGDIIAARQIAEAASIAKSQFLSVMSHELRTPLNAIMGLFELIKMSGGGEKAVQFATRGLSSSEHLLGLITDILDFASIEAGNLSVTPAPFRLGSLIADVSHAASVGRKADVEVMVALSDPLRNTEFMGDALRLKQVLINLLGNALKFTDAGWIVLSVGIVGGTGEVPVLEFAVSDTGIGMSPDQQSRLFQPFVQVDMSSRRRFGGSGLGLIISQRLVELMGGEPISVESRQGHGSRFAFRLPLPVIGGLSSLQSGEPADVPAQPTGRLAGYRLLIVDDNEDARFIARLLLEAEGATVAETEDGAQGVTAALKATEPFDAVLMDMRMPVMNGLDATRELRARGYVKPIIALTANAFRSDIEACRSAGMDDYITKPVKIEKLVEVLQRQSVI